jgi:phosphoglucosamine mutase
MDAGVVISASHNPYEDNGIKIFRGDGFKLSDDEEMALEHLAQSGEPADGITHFWTKLQRKSVNRGLGVPM